jgi:hypothetical protein
MFRNGPKAATGRNADYSRRLASGWSSRLVATAAEPLVDLRLLLRLVGLKPPAPRHQALASMSKSLAGMNKSRNGDDAT